MSQLFMFPELVEPVVRPLMARDLPADTRPVYRIQRTSPGALANTELLQLVGRFRRLATASELLVKAESLAGLTRMSIPELTTLSGIGPTSAAAIKAALELGRRGMAEAGSEAPTIRAPDDCANLLMAEMRHLEQEHLVTVILNTRNRVIKVHTCYVGSLNASMVRVGELFREAIRRNGAAIIVAHNHPSGDPTPSPEDVTITVQFVKAGSLMDIDVLDHLIIGDGRFVSLKERGLGFS